MPGDLAPHLDHLFLLVEKPHKPLAGRQVLKRAVAFFVVPHRVLNLLRFVLQGRAVARRRVFGVTQQLDHDCPRRWHALADHLLIVFVGFFRIFTGPAVISTKCVIEDSPVPAQYLPQFQAFFSPPRDVDLIAESTDHQDSGALFRVGLRARENRNFCEETGRDRLLAEKALEPHVVRVGGNAHARSQQFRPRRGNHKTLYRRVFLENTEFDVVVSPALLTVFDLGLGHGGLEIDVPHRRGFELIHMALPVEVEEAALGDAPALLVDRRVLVAPVDRVAHAHERVLEGHFVQFGHHAAHLDEVLATDHKLLVFLEFKPRALGLNVQVFDVGNVGFRPHSEIVLHAPLGRQAVIVPAHRVGNVPAGHALIAGDQVLVGVREDMTDVERTADGRGRGVDHKRTGTGCAWVAFFDAEFAPALPPVSLTLVDVKALWKIAKLYRLHFFCSCFGVFDSPVTADFGNKKPVQFSGQVMTRSKDGKPAVPPSLPTGCLRDL